MTPPSFSTEKIALTLCKSLRVDTHYEWEKKARQQNCQTHHTSSRSSPSRITQTTHLGLGAPRDEWGQYYMDSKLQWDPFRNTSKGEADLRTTPSPQLSTGKGDRKPRMVQHTEDEHGRRSRRCMRQGNQNSGLWPQAQVPNRKKTQRHHQWQSEANTFNSASPTTVTGCAAFSTMLHN